MTAKTFLLFMLCGAFFSSHAQDTIHLRKDIRKSIVTDRQPQALYAELGGAGVAFSVNYDRRFGDRLDGLGWRAGIGYSFDNFSRFTSLPLGINYLKGNARLGRYFEMGVNETLVFVAGGSHFGDAFFINDQALSGTVLVNSMHFGYRSQPPTGGFNFRAGLMPCLISGSSGMGVYFSMGFNF